MTFLSKMAPGQRGRIVGFSHESPVARRLIELGLIPGRELVYLRNAPLADPMEIQIGQCCLSLRHSEAAMVAVELAE